MKINLPDRDDVAPLQGLGSVSPDHHLWRNNGTYFVQVMLQRSPHGKTRLRRSLGTKDAETARRRRDELLKKLEQTPGMSLLLRFRRPCDSRGMRPVVDRAPDSSSHLS